MNQILDTGEEQFKNNNINYGNYKGIILKSSCKQ